MAVNKIVYAGNSLIDLTDDTVTADKLSEGITAHDKSGNKITGTMTSSGSSQVKEPYIEETYDTSGNLIDARLHGYDKIRDYMFSGCSKLAITSLPSGLTSVGISAFERCYQLALTSLPSGITSIGTSAFYNCTRLAITSLPSGLTSVGDSAFSRCPKLAITSLPSGITNIGSMAFASCTSIISLTFQGTPSIIRRDAFRGSTNLRTINVPWAEGAVSGAPWGATNATINYNYNHGWTGGAD